MVAPAAPRREAQKAALPEGYWKGWRQLRKARGLSQEALAGALGISYSAYRRYESGEREPDASTLWKIADYYTVTVDYLLGRSDWRN